MSILKLDGKPKAAPVSPIKNPKDIKKIRQYLLGKSDKRDYAIWVCGTNFLLRAGDLLSIKWCNILESDGSLKDRFRVQEGKTDKSRDIRLNNDVKEALVLYKNALGTIDPDDYLFKSRKEGREGDHKLTVPSLHKLIKTTCRELGIKGNYGSHTLRKTGAYKIYMDHIEKNPRILSTLQKILNHSSQSITLRYIGIEDEEIDDIFFNMKW